MNSNGFAHKRDSKLFSDTQDVSLEELKERLWIDSSLAKFDNLLRINYDKPIDEFAEVIISEIAIMTKAVRATFFVADTELQVLKASAGYACTLETMEKTQFKFGEDLIGQVAKNKELMVLDNIPVNNVFLKSSLGPLSATYMLIIPLIFNNVVYGVIELLYINKVNDSIVDLLKRLSANVAAMVQSTINNERTKELLNQSLQTQEMLQATEEELRQSMEEMQATHEAMQEKQKELKISESRSNAYFENSIDAIIATDSHGQILRANTPASEILNYELEEFQAINIEDLIKNLKINNLKSFLNRKRRIKALKKDGTEFKAELFLTRTVIFEEVNYLAYIRDISKEIRKEQEIAESLIEMDDLKLNINQLNHQINGLQETSINIFQTMKNPIFLTDLNGTISFINAEGENLFKNNLEESSTNIRVLFKELESTPIRDLINKNTKVKVTPKGRHGKLQELYVFELFTNNRHNYMFILK